MLAEPGEVEGKRGFQKTRARMLFRVWFSGMYHANVMVSELRVAAG